MRIGVRITEEAIFGVLVDDGQIRGSETVVATVSDDLGAAFEQLLIRLHVPRDQRSPGLSITFDVSRLLVPSPLETVTAVRIAPRPPTDAAHSYSGETTAQYAEHVQHVTGGFTKEGEEIAALDVEGLRRIAKDAPAGRRYVLTGVGASVNSNHELEASRILFAEANPASVTHSHSFHNSSFAVRERTSVINSALLAEGQRIITALAAVAAKLVPHARLFVMTNDGGSAPLSALAVKPVHSMLSASAAELVGAATIAGVDDGWIVIQRVDGEVLGEMADGTPAYSSRSKISSSEVIATRTAQLIPNSEGLIGDWMGVPVVVANVDRIDTSVNPRLSKSRHVRSSVDLAGLGAACAPLVEWLEQDVKIRSEIEKDQVLLANETKVRMRLVSNGVSPSEVRILESRIIGASYENSNTVAVRVRGIGGQRPSRFLTESAK